MHRSKEKKPKKGNEAFSAFSEQSTALLKNHSRNLKPPRKLIPSQSPLFPWGEVMSLSIDWKVTLLGVVIETLELAGLLVNSQLPWGTGVNGVFDKVLYTFILPFFDDTWASGLKILWKVIIAVFLVLSVFLFSTILYYANGRVHALPGAVVSVMRYVMHLLPSVLAIPIFSTLGSTGSCDKTYSYHYWDSSACFSGLIGAFQVLSYIGMLLFLGIIYLGLCFCFEDMPSSSALAARPRCVYYALGLGARIVLTLLFHYLIPMQEKLPYAIVFLVVSLALLSVHVFSLPYYRMLMNQLRGMQWGISSGISLVVVINIACDTPESEYTTKITSLILVICLAVGGGVAGFFLPLFRRNSAFTYRLRCLELHSERNLRKPQFPTGLPVNDLILSNYPRIEKVIQNKHLPHKVREGGNGESIASTQEMDPYLSAVYVPDDVEVSCRFLQQYTKISPDGVPSLPMVLFAARIFTKGMVLFPENSQVRYQFCVFLAVFAKKLRMSLTEVIFLSHEKMYISVPLRFRIYRFTEGVKESLNMVNTRGLLLASISSELHREILGAISLFWGTLAGGTRSTTELLEIVEYISKKRESCRKFYQTILQTPSDSALLSYSVFLRDVMLDEQGAERIKHTVLEGAEMRRNQRAQHASENASSYSVRQNWDTKAAYRAAVQEVTQRGRMTKIEKSMGQSTSVTTLHRLVKIIFPMILLMTLGIFIFILIHMSLMNKSVSRIEASALRNADFMFCVYLVGQISQYYTDSSYDAYLSALKTLLGTTAGMLYDNHYSLTMGNLETSYPLVNQFLNTKRVPYIVENVLSIEGDYDRRVGELFDLGFSFVTTFQTIASSTSPSPSDLSFVLMNGDLLDQAFNYSTETYIDHRVFVLKSTKWVVYVLACASIFLLLACLTLVLLYINRIEISKESIINLFFIIPKSYVNDLYQKSCDNAVTLANETSHSSVESASDSEEEQESKPLVLNTTIPGSPEEGTLPKPSESSVVPLSTHLENSGVVQSRPTTANKVPLASSESRPSSKKEFAILAQGEEEEGEGKKAADGLRVGDITEEEKELLFWMDDDTSEQLDQDFGFMEDERDEKEDGDEEIFVKMVKTVNRMLLNSKLQLILIILCFILSIIIFGMLFMLNQTANNVRDRYSDNHKFFSLMEDYFLYFSELTLNAQQYVFTGDLVHPQRYYQNVLSTDIESLFTSGVYDFTNPRTVEAVVNIERIIYSAAGRQTVAFWLASSTADYAAKITPDKEYIFSLINGIEHTYDYTQLASLLSQLFAPYNPAIPTTTRASTNTVDAALSDTDKLNAAINLVADDYYQDHQFLLAKYLQDFVATKSTNDEKQHTLLKTYWGLAIAFTSICLLLFLNIFREAVAFHRGLRLILPLGSCLLLMVGILVGLGLMDTTITGAGDYNTFLGLFSIARNITSVNLFAAQGYALRLVTYGYPSALALWSDLFSASLEQLLTQVLLASVDEKTAKNNLAYLASLTMMNGYDSIENTMYYSSVAAQISLSIYPTLKTPPALDGFTYNIALEPDYQISLYATGAKLENLYSSTTVDDAITDVGTKTKKAVSAVAGRRADYVIAPYFQSVEGVVNDLNLIVQSRWTDVEKFLIIYPLTVMIFGSVLMGLTALLTIYVGYAVYMESALNLQRRHVSRHHLVKKVRTRRSILLRLSLPVVVLLLLYAGLLLIFSLLVNTDLSLSRNYKTVHSRLVSALETLEAAQQVWYGNGATAAKSPFTAKLKTYVQNSVETTQELYLGNGGSFTGILRSNLTADEYLFGPSACTYEEYALSCQNFLVSDDYSILSFKSSLNFGAPSTESLAYLFKFGAENIWFQYLVAFGNMVGSYSADQRAALVVPVTSTVEILVSRVRAIFQGFYHSEDSLPMILTYLVIAFSLLIFVAVAGVLFLMYIPVLKHIAQEEEGTRLLLRMIPQRIRKEVPLLRDFFENGVVNEDLQLLGDACSSVDTSLQVVVNEDDRIIDVTNEVMKTFKYTKDEILESYFDQLLSANCAKAMVEHRKQVGSTRLKVFVGKTVRSAGVRSDGEIFPMEIHVRDVPQVSHEGENRYVVRLRSVEAECQVELTRRIYAMLSESSQHPIIVMDSTGVILVCNIACEQLFGIESKHLVGFHMSTLFSSKEEMGTFELNQYFSKIRSEGESFDTIQAIGRGKHNMDIPVRVSLTSIVSDEKVVVYVVATLLDRSDDYRARQITAASRAAISSSPVPLVLFNHAGKILNFSPAAEKSWGIPAERAIRLNVKDLLHESDAQRFNFTLGPHSDIRYFVGVTRALMAKRSTGEIFVVEARMKEMKTEKGDEIAVCYFKDLSKEMDISRRNIMSQSAFDMCPIAIIVIDTMGEVKGVNRAAEKLFGYRANIIEGQNVKVLMPDNIASKHDEYLARYAKTGVKNMLNGTRREYAKRADGRLFAVELTIIELEVDDLLGEAKRRKLFVGYIRDMSEQQQMQQTNDVHDAIIQNCPTPIISVDKLGLILSFNPAASKLFGHSPSAVMGKNVSILMPERYARHHDSHIQHASKKRGAPVDSLRDVVALNSSGVEIPVRIHVMELRRGVVSPVFVAAVKDLSVKSRIQDDCKLEQAFISQYPRSIIVVSRTGVTKFFSEEAAKAFGFSSAEAAMNAPLSSMLNTNDRSESERMVSALLAIDSPEFGTPKKVACRRRDGVPFIANIIAKKMEDDRLQPDREGKNTVESKKMSIVLLLDNLTYQGLVTKSAEIQEELLHKFEYGTAKLNEKGDITVVNQTFLQEFGLPSKESVIGKPFASFIPGELGVEIAQQITAYTQAGVDGTIFSDKMEFQLSRSDSTKVHLELMLRSVLCEEKQTIFLAYIRNIDATFFERNSRKLIRDMIQTSPIPAIVIRYGWKKGAGLTGEDGTIYVVNPSALQQFAYASAELVGKHLQTLLTPTGKGSRSLTEQFYITSKSDRKEDNDEDLMNVIAQGNAGRPGSSVGRVMRNQSLFSYSTYAVGMRKDRSTFPARVSMMEFFDGEHNHSSLFVFIDETTDLIKQQVNCFMGSVAEGMCPLAIICTNGKGEIVLFSEQAEAMFGMKEKEVLKKPASLLVDADNCGEWITRMSDPSTGLRKQSLFLPRILGKKKNGSLLSLEVTMYESEGETNGDRLFVSLMRDTTEELADNLAGQLSQVAMASFGTPFFVTSSAGMVELVNDSLLNLLQYTREELLHNTIKVILSPETSRLCDEYAQNTEDTNKNSVLCTKVKRKDGREVLVELLLGVFRSHGKTSLYSFVSSLEDDVELRKEHTFTEALGSIEKMVVLYVESSGIIQDATLSASRLFKAAREESLIGVHIGTLFPTIENFSSFVESHRNDGGITLRGRTSAGESIFCAVGIKETSTQGDEVSYALLLYDFGSEAERQKHLLQTSLTSLASMGVVVSDAHHTILHVNEEICGLFHYSNPNELIGKNFLCLMGEDVKESQRQRSASRESTAKEIGIFRLGQVSNVTGVTKDGAPLSLVLRYEAMETPKGKEFLSFFSPVEEKHANGEKLSHALLSLYPSPVMILSQSGKILTCSTSAMNMMKLSKNVIGANANSFIQGWEELLRQGRYVKRVAPTKEEFLFRSVPISTGAALCTVYRP